MATFATVVSSNEVSPTTTVVFSLAPDVTAAQVQIPCSHRPVCSCRVPTVCRPDKLTLSTCLCPQLDLSVSPEHPTGCRLHLSLAGQGAECLSVALPSTAYSTGLEPVASYKKKKRELTVQVPWADLEARKKRSPGERRRTHCGKLLLGPP